jgi:hypothetical protein
VTRRPSPYAGRTIVLTTKHGKDRAVALPLRLALGADLVVPEGIDTDALGTFTGEISRVGTPRETAERKARLGMAALNLPLGLASDGSFGPDPAVPFIVIDHELLVFMDDELGITVCEQTLTTETNFTSADVSSVAELESFLRRAQFPSHAVIVRPRTGGEPGDVRKGIRSLAELEMALVMAARRSGDGLARVETDMRARLNPLRARAIRRLAFRLALRLRTHCSACDAPGWGRVDVASGLPCRWCGSPTDLVLHEIHACPRCDHREHRPRGDDLAAADPGQCSYCNP